MRWNPVGPELLREDEVVPHQHPSRGTPNAGGHSYQSEEQEIGSDGISKEAYRRDAPGF